MFIPSNAALLIPLTHSLYPLHLSKNKACLENQWYSRILMCCPVHCVPGQIGVAVCLQMLRSSTETCHVVPPQNLCTGVLHFVDWSTSNGSTETFLDHVIEVVLWKYIWVSEIIIIELKSLAGIGKKFCKLSLWSWVSKYTSINTMHDISRDQHCKFVTNCKFWNLIL